MIAKMRQTYRDLAANIDNTFATLIAKGKTFRFESNDVEVIEENAEQIDYTATGFFDYYGEVGYLLGIDENGINILTREREKKVIPFGDLDSLLDKMTILEKLNGE